jgi:hypothetical protein
MATFRVSGTLVATGVIVSDEAIYIFTGQR